MVSQLRIRSTKPEFWRSERIASVSWDARLVLKGLESYVDDNGVGKDDIALIVTDVFPRDMVADPRETVARVSEAISSLHRAGLVWRYESDGTRLLYISWWEDVQRIDKPGKGRLPRPDGTMDYRSSIIRDSLASPPETLAPGTGEQGNRGTGEQIPVETSQVCHQGADRVAPAQKCPRHIDDPSPPDCGGCAEANRSYKRWVAAERKREQAETKKKQSLAQLIRDCPECDDYGRDDDLNPCPLHPALKEAS